MMLKRKRPCALALLLITLLPMLLSCVKSPDINAEDALCTFTDDRMRTVSVKESPQRVAVLFSSFADVWQSAGGTVSVTVGESVERGFASADAILVDRGAGKTVNTELLLASKPDLVICSADIEAQVKCAELLERHGIAVACFRVESFSDYLRVLDVCTQITGRRDCYQKNGLDVKARIDDMLSEVRKSEKHREILFVRASATSVKAKSSRDHFASAMLSELGAHNVADDTPLLIDGLGGETILQKNPSHVFVSIMGNEESARQALFSNTVLSSLDAVKNGRCHILPKELFQYKPNARWDEAYRYLIGILYENVETKTETSALPLGTDP